MATISERETLRDRIEASPRRDLAAGYRWPIAPAALAALTDMGLSDTQIGAYFAVGADNVGALRAHYRDRNRG